MNDLVKVRVDGEWKVGNLCAPRSGRTEKTKVILQSDIFTQKVTEVDGNDVKKYTTITDANKQPDDIIDSIANQIQSILDELIPNQKLKVKTYRGDNVLIPEIRVYRTSLCPSTIDIETIGEFIERESWCVSNTYPIQPWVPVFDSPEPTWEETQIIGNFRNVNDAIGAFVQNVFKDFVEDYFEKQRCEGMAHEYLQ
jgi:hypothetical protein